MDGRRRVRIVSDGSPFAQITNASTGEVIYGVRNVAIELPAGEPVVARLEVIAEIEVTAEAEVRRLRLNETTGAYEPIDPATATIDDLRALQPFVDGLGRVHPVDIAETVRTGWVTYGSPEPADATDTG